MHVLSGHESIHVYFNPTMYNTTLVWDHENVGGGEGSSAGLYSSLLYAYGSSTMKTILWKRVCTFQNME